MARRRLQAIALLVVVVGAGCSQSGPDGDTGASRAGDNGSVGSVFGRREDNELLHLAEQTLIQRCMEQQGFQFKISALGKDEFEAHPYGNDDVERSQAQGYSLDAPLAAQANGDAPANSEDPNAAYIASLSPQQSEAFSRALFGPPDGDAGSVRLPGGPEIGFPLEGCLADAREELYNEGEALMEAVSIIDNLATMVQSRVVEDRAYLAALKRWKACMDEQGYDVERPADAVRIAMSTPSTGDTEAARTQEIAIAVADATCARKAELVATGERLEATVWEDVLDENTGVLEAYRELRGPALERAKSVLER